MESREREGRIHFQSEGEGPAVLLLHAFPLSTAMWSGQVAALRERFRVVTLDFPGFGRSAPVAEASLEGFAVDALSILDRLSIGRAAVVGLSMGGYVAFRLFDAAPGRVAALALCDTRAAADGDEARRQREATARTVEAEGSRALVPGLLPKLVSPAAPAGVRASVERMILDAPAPGVAGALRAMARRPDSFGLLGRIGCPTLVVVGGDDTLTPPADSEAMARGIPGSRLVVIEGSGHLANLERPGPFNAALSEFLDTAGAW